MELRHNVKSAVLPNEVKVIQGKGSKGSAWNPEKGAPSSKDVLSTPPPHNKSWAISTRAGGPAPAAGVGITAGVAVYTAM